MTTNTTGKATRIRVAAGHCGLIGLVVAVMASPSAAQTAADLTRPASVVEIGGAAVTDGSYKAGEFNGLQKKGGAAIGSLDFRGGGLYDSDNAFRFRVRAHDLGLSTGGATAEAGIQGRFRVTAGFDMLRRNRSDSYQTPYNGAGTSSLTLPGSWLVPTVAGSSGSNNAVNNTSARGLVPSIGTAPYIDLQTTSPNIGTAISPNATQRALVEAAANADLPLFHQYGIYTTRTRFDAAVAVNLSEQLGLDASLRPEHREGTKLMGTVSRNTGGDIATIIPDRIDTDTSQLNLSLNFKSARAFAQAAYYGSSFTNNVASISWQNWATPSATVNTMSSTPGNNFNQFSASAGVNFTSTTKLVAAGSYGRNTQNGAFLTDITTPVVPVTSLDGLIVSSAASVKLTSRPVKPLFVAASYKYDNRDNRTPIHIYQYGDAGELPNINANFPAGAGNPLGPILADNANANRPYSRKVNQANVDLDYAIVAGQHLTGSYEYQRTNRECPGSWADCADAPVTNESIFKAAWRLAAGPDVAARLGYEYARRKAPGYNEDAFLALVPYANVVPAGQTISANQAMSLYKLTGYGPMTGYNGGVFVDPVFFPSNNALANALYGNRNRISELAGMRRYYVADRNRNRVRGALTWQPGTAIAFQANVDYGKDDFPTSTYGVQNSKTWTADGDASYAISDQLSADVFYTYEHIVSGAAGNTYTANSNASSVNGFTAVSGNGCDGYTSLQQRNNNNKLDPCLDWFSTMTDSVNTIGFGLRGRSGKLDAALNLSSSQAKTDNAFSGGNWANNLLALPGAPPTTVAAFFVPASATPRVSTSTIELRLNASYAVAKGQSVRVAYTYMHMKSNDWVYEGMQMGSGTPSGVLPTNEQAFNYTVNVIGVWYTFGF